MSLGRHPRVWFVLLAIVVTSVMTVPSLAQTENDPEGRWVSKFDSPQGEVTLMLTLMRTDSGWSGYMEDSRFPRQELKDVFATATRARFKVVVPDFPVTPEFTGTFNAAGTALTGQMSVQTPQGVQTKDLLFNRVKDAEVDPSATKRYTAGSGPNGIWIGQVKSPDGEESEIRMTVDKVGQAWTAVVSGDDIGDVPGENVQVTDTRISFTFRPVGAPFPANFSGSYIAGDDRVTGSFSMRGNSRFVKFRRDPSSVYVAGAVDGEPVVPARIRHDYHFALTARAAYWPALHVVKDEVYNINNLTSSTFNYDGTLRWYAMDSFCLLVRGVKGGLGFKSDEARLAEFEEIGLTSDSYLKLDTFEFGIMGFLGNVMMRNSKFNPFISLVGGSTNWELTESGRGSEVLEILQVPLQGTSFSAGFGLGTEYELNKSFALEFEWMWRYYATRDEAKWAEPDLFWSNTHAWALSLGLTWGFW